MKRYLIILSISLLPALTACNSMGWNMCGYPGTVGQPGCSDCAYGVPHGVGYAQDGWQPQSWHMDPVQGEVLVPPQAPTPILPGPAERDAT